MAGISLLDIVKTVNREPAGTAQAHARVPGESLSRSRSRGSSQPSRRAPDSNSKQELPVNARNACLRHHSSNITKIAKSLLHCSPPHDIRPAQAYQHAAVPQPMPAIV